MYIKVWLENAREIDYIEDLGIDRKIVKVDLKEIGWEGICWIRLPRIGLSGCALVLSYLSLV